MSDGHAALQLIRSQVPSGRVASVDTAAAEELPGILTALTGRDLSGSALPDGSSVLADTLAYQGQPVAAIVGETDYLAADGAELVEVVVQPDPASDSPPPSLDEPGSTGGGTARVAQPRWHVAPLETNQCLASPLPGSDAVVLNAPVRDPETFGRAVAAAAGMAAGHVRVEAGAQPGRALIAADRVLPGHVLAVVAAKRLGRAVRWQETRAESMTTGGAQAGFSVAASFDGAPGDPGGVLSIRLRREVGARGLPPAVDLSALGGLPWYGVGELLVEVEDRLSNLPPALTDAAGVLGPVFATEALIGILAAQPGRSRRAVTDDFARAGGELPAGLLAAVRSAVGEVPAAGSSGAGVALAPGVAAGVTVRLDRRTGEWAPGRASLAVPCPVGPSLRAALTAGAVDGYGLASMQQILFDEQGTCLAATLMDYMMPTAYESPEVVVVEVGPEAAAPYPPDLARLLSTAAVASAARNALVELVPGLAGWEIPVSSAVAWEAAAS